MIIKIIIIRKLHGKKNMFVRLFYPRILNLYVTNDSNKFWCVFKKKMRKITVGECSGSSFFQCFEHIFHGRFGSFMKAAISCMCQSDFALKTYYALHFLLLLYARWPQSAANQCFLWNCSACNATTGISFRSLFFLGETNRAKYREMQRKKRIKDFCCATWKQDKIEINGQNKFGAMQQTMKMHYLCPSFCTNYFVSLYAHNASVAHHFLFTIYSSEVGIYFFGRIVIFLQPQSVGISIFLSRPFLALSLFSGFIVTLNAYNSNWPEWMVHQYQPATKRSSDSCLNGIHLTLSLYTISRAAWDAHGPIYLWWHHNETACKARRMFAVLKYCRAYILVRNGWFAYKYTNLHKCQFNLHGLATKTVRTDIVIRTINVRFRINSLFLYLVWERMWRGFFVRLKANSVKCWTYQADYVLLPFFAVSFFVQDILFLFPLSLNETGSLIDWARVFFSSELCILFLRLFCFQCYSKSLCIIPLLFVFLGQFTIWMCNVNFYASHFNLIIWWCDVEIEVLTVHLQWIGLNNAMVF